MRWSLVPSVIFAVWLASSAASDSARADEGPSAVASRYLAARVSGEIDTLFALDFDAQSRAQEIRATKPEVLWDKLVGELRASFGERHQRLPGVFAFEPTHEILETREIVEGMPPRARTKIYVRFSYADPARSPLHAEHPDGPGSVAGLIKSWIGEVHVDNLSGLVTGFVVVDEGLELWQEPPFFVLSLRREHTGSAEAWALGGVPPYGAVIDCGDETFQGSGSAGLNFQLLSASGTCRIVASDAAGHRDEAWFVLQALSKPQGSLGVVTAKLRVDWYGREPWHSIGYGNHLSDPPRASLSALTDEAPE